jgi:hypothetical protein
MFQLLKVARNLKTYVSYFKILLINGYCMHLGAYVLCILAKESTMFNSVIHLNYKLLCHTKSNACRKTRYWLKIFLLGLLKKRPNVNIVICSGITIWSKSSKITCLPWPKCSAPICSGYPRTDQHDNGLRYGTGLSFSTCWIWSLVRSVWKVFCWQTETFISRVMKIWR